MSAVSKSLAVLLSACLVIAVAAAAADEEETLSAIRELPAAYTPGQKIQITVTITFTGVISALGVQDTVPEGWTYVSATCPIRPPAKAEGELSFAWLTDFSSPLKLTYTVQVPENDCGRKKISGHVLYRRMGGEEKASIQDSLLSFPCPLVVKIFAIDSGASTATRRGVMLANTATGDPVEYLASESPDFAGAPWQPYSSTPLFELSAPLGLKTVYLKVKDAAGKESPSVSDTITLQEKPAGCGCSCARRGTTATGDAALYGVVFVAFVVAGRLRRRR